MNRKLADDQVAQARKLVEAGASIRSVAPRFGVDERTLRRRLGHVSREVDPHAAFETEQRFEEVPVVHLDYAHLDSIRTYPLGDVHKGSPAHNVDKWREWLAYIATSENATMIGTGDFLNSALRTSVSDVYEETMSVGKAKRVIREELRPLAEAERLDVLIQGNHEERITKAVGDCPIEDIAEALGVPYAPASALLIYHVGDYDYRIYVRHGSGLGQSPASLLKAANVIAADVFVTGHTHRQGCLLEDLFVYDEQQDAVVRAPRRYVSAGSFLQYERYCATRGYQPAHLGAPRIFMDGRRHDFHVSI